MSQQYISAGLRGEFPSNQGMSEVYHPQPVSPSGVVDINPQNKHAFEAHLPKPEECTGTGNPMKLHGDNQVLVKVLFSKGQRDGMKFGKTKPEDIPANIHSHSAMRTHQSNALLGTEIEDISMKSRLSEHQVQTLFTEASTLQYDKSINPCTGYKVTDSESSARPMKQLMRSYDEDLAKLKRKKGNDNACSPQKKSKSGVLLPRPNPPRNQPLVTQPSQDEEAVFSPCLLAPQNDARYETVQKEVNEGCHQHLNLTGHTCRVSDQEFLKITEQLKERNHAGLWIIHHDLHPVRGAYHEGHHYKAEILAKGGFGTVSLCWDMVSKKAFIQKSVPKEKWRKAENIALITLKSHPNICELLGMKQESDSDGIRVSLFLENAGMSLTKFVRMTQQGKLTHQEIWDISEQMFCGQVHLHRYGILHLDLKPDNICIQGKPGNLCLKIIDFGSAKLSQEPFRICGMSPEYLAPEVCTYIYVQKYGNIANQHSIKLSEQPISGKADVASGALIILYMIEGYDVLIKCINNGQTSYTGMGKDEVISLRLQLVFTHARNPNLGSHLISDGIDMNLKELLKGCLVGNPDGRFSSQQALQFIEERKNRTKPSKEYFQQDKSKGLQTFQQTTQAGERMFGISSQQYPHGINKHCDKTEPYPALRPFRAATGVIPTTVNPETYPAASDSHGGNLPNLDMLE